MGCRPLQASLVATLIAAGLVVGQADANPAKRSGNGDATAQRAASPRAQKTPAKKAKKPAVKAGKPKAAKKVGSEPLAPNTDARESIAGGPVQESKPQPELDALREMDGALFSDLKPESAKPNAAAQRSTPSTGLPDTIALGDLPLREASTPGAARGMPTDIAWLTSLAQPDIPVRWDARLIRYLDYFKNNPKGRSMAAALIKRSGRYIVPIQAALKDAGLPQDIAFLPLVESAYNPRISSPAGAAGLWQFMPKAAAAYGLRIDRWVDERMDPERSTRAAVRYLTDLHQRFGRWELVFAAYNMGHGGLLSSIRKYNTNDFWELTDFEAGVPFETALYVPKIVALAFVSRNRAVFGCDGVVVDAPEPLLSNNPSKPTFETASVRGNTSLGEVAKVVGVKEAELEALNPELVGETLGTPSAIASVRVPAGKSQAASKLAGGPRRTGSDARHMLRWGESLEAIAAEYGTTEAKLRALNGMSDPMPPRPGIELILPETKASIKPAPLVAVLHAESAIPAGARHVLYEVTWGDTLAGIARELDVSEAELCKWNNVDPTARLHAKMVLSAFVAKPVDETRVKVTTADRARIIKAGTEEFFDYFETKNGRTRTTIATKKGDTMRGIAKSHGLSIGMLERINHISRNTDLEEGRSLVVYTKKSGAPAPSTKPSSTDDPYEGGTR